MCTFGSFSSEYFILNTQSKKSIHVKCLKKKKTSFRGHNEFLCTTTQFHHIIICILTAGFFFFNEIKQWKQWRAF